MVAKGSPPFKVAWYKSDTTESIKYLKDATVDVAITYTPAAEQLAIKQGIAIRPRYYIFREHFLLVGPPSNPAKLDPDNDIDELFSDIFTAAEAGNTNPPVRFLSRFDKSATNIKVSELWIKLGQVSASILSLLNKTDLFRFHGLRGTRHGIISTWHSQFVSKPSNSISFLIVLNCDRHSLDLKHSDWPVWPYLPFTNVPRNEQTLRRN